MIKFRCSECDKKLGVPDSAAGKRVKCPQCGSPARVPADGVSESPASSSSPAAAAKPKASKPQGDWLSDLAAAGEDVSPTHAPSTVGERAKGGGHRPSSSGNSSGVCPSCNKPVRPEAVLCINCGESLDGGDKARTKVRKAPKQGGAIASAGAAAEASGRLVATLIAGGIAAAIGAGIWAGIVMVTGYEIGYVAWGVGLITGIGAVAGAGGQSFFTGLVSGGLALGGVIFAKVLIVMWVVPSMLTSGSLLYDEAKETPNGFVKAYIVVQEGKNNEVTQDEAIKAVGSMNEKQKRELMGELGELIVDGEVPGVPGIELADTFSGMDGVFIALAVFTAFGIGNGKPGED